MQHRSTPPAKILVVCHGAIGDVVRALPLVARIARAWPETRIHWAVEPISRPLVENHPYIQKVIVFQRGGGLPAFRRFTAQLRAERYDLVLDLQRHLKSGVTSFLTRAPRRIGFNRRNSREGNFLFNTEHVPASDHFSSKIDQFQKFGDHLGLPPLAPLDFGLMPSHAELDEAESLLQQTARAAGIVLPEATRRVGLILGSTWPSRFWGAQQYIELIAEYRRRWQIEPVLIGGASELDIATAILAETAATSLVQRTKLRQLAAVFSRMGFAVGSDSGPMHIAAAVKVPVISLWGSTSPKRSAPYGSEGYVLQSAIGCSPCYQRRCPGLDTLCMKDIPWQVVASLSAKILEGQREG